MEGHRVRSGYLRDELRFGSGAELEVAAQTMVAGSDHRRAQHAHGSHQQDFTQATHLIESEPARENEISTTSRVEASSSSSKPKAMCNR